MKRKNTADMTREEFERWLKRNNITGMAAVSAWANRRVKIDRRAVEQARKDHP